MTTAEHRTFVEGALLDVDGSCRDLNVDRASWVGIRTLVDKLRADFETVTVGSASDGIDESSAVTVGQALNTVESRGGYVQLLFKGGSNILTHLQIFVAVGVDEPLFLEVTFFPQDLRPKTALFDAFTSWASDLCETVGGTRYFVRYESASWQFGDAGPNSGVFLVQDVPRVDEPT
jgi:hypothetical protein